MMRYAQFNMLIIKGYIGHNIIGERASSKRTHAKGKCQVEGLPFNFQGEGVIADKLFISTRLGGALKISNFITWLV